MQVIRRRPRPQTANDVLLKRVPGWKPPKQATETGPDGEPIAVVSNVYQREPILPEFADLTEQITKDAAE